MTGHCIATLNATHFMFLNPTQELLAVWMYELTTDLWYPMEGPELGQVEGMIQPRCGVITKVNSIIYQKHDTIKNLRWFFLHYFVYDWHFCQVHTGPYSSKTEGLAIEFVISFRRRSSKRGETEILRKAPKFKTFGFR